MIENLFGFIGGLILVVLTFAVFFFMSVVGLHNTIKILLFTIVGLITLIILFKMIRHVERK